jgi:hypothetical protein
MDNLIIWILVYFILASQFYILDKKGKFFLRKLYLYLYNLGHRQEKTLEEVDQGFVYNQSVGTRLTVAAIFDIVISIAFWKINILGNGIKIILMFIGTPTVFLGFWFGGVLLEAISRIFRKTVKTIDDIETGKIDPLEQLQQGYEEAKQEFSSASRTCKEASSVKTASSSIEEEIENADQQQKDEALAALRAFQKGSRNVK